MIVKDNKQMAKLTTQTTLVLAHAICSVWKWGRKLGNKNNFDYFIRDLSTQYPTTNKMAEASLASSPFINKVVLVDDEYERSISLKIGNIAIEYSFDKTLEENNTIPLFRYEPREKVIDALIKITHQRHYNASVLQFSKNRKEQNGGKHRKSNS